MRKVLTLILSVVALCASAAGDNVTVQLGDEVPAGAKELSISAPGLVNGINAVTLSVDDEKIDSKKFVK